MRKSENGFPIYVASPTRPLVPVQKAIGIVPYDQSRKILFYDNGDWPIFDCF